MANDLGLSGIPSVPVWVKVEKQITKNLSNIVEDSTGQSRKRLDHIESTLVNLQHNFGVLVDLLQNPTPDSMPTISGEMGRLASGSAVPWQVINNPHEIFDHPPKQTSQDLLLIIHFFCEIRMINSSFLHNKVAEFIAKIAQYHRKS